MGKYRDVADETKNLFFDVLDNTAIPQWIEFKVLADDKLKKVCDPKKQSELVEHISEGTNIVFLINEDIFDGLEEEYQKKEIEEELARIVVDDNDNIKVLKYDFTTDSGFLEKYGADDVILLHLSVISLFEKKKQEEEEEKARIREEKKKKKK